MKKHIVCRTVIVRKSELLLSIQNQESFGGRGTTTAEPLNDLRKQYGFPSTTPEIIERIRVASIKSSRRDHPKGWMGMER